MRTAYSPRDQTHQTHQSADARQKKKQPRGAVNIALSASRSQELTFPRAYHDEAGR